MVTLEELAKYLLKNRFVQTRSYSALTITASLKDTEGQRRFLSLHLRTLPVSQSASRI